MEPFIPTKLPFDISGWNLQEILKKVSSTSSSLAYYNGVLQSIINPSIFLSPLEIKEAVLSSRIEGTVTTLDEVLRYEADIKPESEEKERDIVEVLNYRKALRHAADWLTRGMPFNTNLICEIQKELMAGVRGKNKLPGKLRKDLVWIGAPGCKIEDAAYLPPEPLSISYWLENLFNFVNVDDTEVLLQSAILHAQFEIIHPFMDGNGRTGRILIPLFLWHKNRLKAPMLYISEYLNDNREIYTQKLLDISEKGKWEEWVKFFLDAVEVQAGRNATKALEVLKLYDQMKTSIANITKSPYGIVVLDTLFRLLTFRSTDFKNIANLNAQTSNRILSRLKDEGILMTLKEASGRSPEVLRFSPLYELIKS